MPGINPSILSRLEATIKIFGSLYDAGATFGTTLRGNEREIFVSEFLRKCVPAAVGIGTGEIVDNGNRKTGQLDVVVEAALRPSFGIPATEAKVYMAHSVAMVLEIKSTLTKTVWDKEIEPHAAKVRALTRQLVDHKKLDGAILARWRTERLKGAFPTAFPDKIPYIVVAFRANWKDSEGLNRVLQASDNVDGVLTFGPTDTRYLIKTGNRPAVLEGSKALFSFLVSVNHISRFSDLLIDDSVPGEWFSGGPA